MEKMTFKEHELLLAKYDLVFKAIFINDGDLDLLASLLSSVLNLNLNAKDIIVINSELPALYERGKLARLDIRVKAADGKEINVEIQLRDENNIGKRSLFYLSRLYTDQMETGMDFQEISPAIAITILGYNHLPFEEYHNRYRMKNTEREHELTEAFELNIIELKKVPETIRDMKDAWMTFLNADKEEVLLKLMEQNPIFEKAVNRLIYVSADEKLRYEMDMREKAELDYQSAMKRSRRLGMEEGLEQGLEKGLEQGKEEEKNETAKRLLLMGLSAEEVSKGTECPIEKVLEIQQSLTKGKITN